MKGGNIVFVNGQRNYFLYGSVVNIFKIRGMVVIGKNHMGNMVYDCGELFFQQRSILNQRLWKRGLLLHNCHD